MSDVLTLPCGTTVECCGATPGAHDWVAQLEVTDRAGGLFYLDADDGEVHCTSRMAVCIEFRSLVPLIQWLTLLEQELRR